MVSYSEISDALRPLISWFSVGAFCGTGGQIRRYRNAFLFHFANQQLIKRKLERACRNISSQIVNLKKIRCRVGTWVVVNRRAAAGQRCSSAPSADNPNASCHTDPARHRRTRCRWCRSATNFFKPAVLPSTSAETTSSLTPRSSQTCPTGCRYSAMPGAIWYSTRRTAS